MNGFKKASNWLNDRCRDSYYPIVLNRKGYAEFVAYVFKLTRTNKVSVYYVMDMYKRTIKRICLY